MSNRFQHPFWETQLLWLYSCCFMECCFQDLFNIAHSILVQFPSSFFSVRRVSVNVVHPYSRIDTNAARKKLCFILSNRFDFHMIENLLMAVDAFASCILMSVAVDETLLPRQVNLSIDFRKPPFRVEIIFDLTTCTSFVCFHMETNATCCLLLNMLQGFGLGRCICKNRYIICVVCIWNSLCEVSPASCRFPSLNLSTFKICSQGRLWTDMRLMWTLAEH